MWKFPIEDLRNAKYVLTNQRLEHAIKDQNHSCCLHFIFNFSRLIGHSLRHNNGSVNSKRTYPAGYLSVICHFVLEKLQIPHSGTGRPHKNPTVVLGWPGCRCPIPRTTPKLHFPLNKLKIPYIYGKSVMIWSKRVKHPTQIDSSSDVLIVFDCIDCYDCYWLFLMYWLLLIVFPPWSRWREAIS